MMIETLEIKLNETLVGFLTRYQGGRTTFVFDESYAKLNESVRPILSMSFEDFNQVYQTRQRLPRFFSNLLPEGAMREFLISTRGIHSEDEFALLKALGNDLPGAVIARPTNEMNLNKNTLKKQKKEARSEAMHFSLAGVQIKFSMLKDKSWFTFAKLPRLGDYILKTPSFLYENVPENEFSMMTLARKVGIDVPEIDLISIDKLAGLPNLNFSKETQVYAIKRFDRSAVERIHIEDFSQVLNVKPQDKYSATNYDTMAKFLFLALPNGEVQLLEFLKRLFFNIIIGNTDAHLKNWSLIYVDGITPALAPAYDLVSTLPYLNNHSLALNFAKQKQFYAINRQTLAYFAKRIGVEQKLVFGVAKETLEAFQQVWQAEKQHLPISQFFKEILETHFKRLTLV